MNKSLERQHFIPIADTDIKWKQICEIPVIPTELKISGLSPITRLRFSITPGKPSPLDFLAGGENLEITGTRIRTQMTRLLTRLDDMEESDLPPGLVSQTQAIKKYFTEN